MNTERIVWTYWVSRDSIRGQLVPTCSIWWIKPVRKVRRGRCTTWTDADENQPGRFGDYTLDETRGFCRTVPDTDLELIVVEQWACGERAAAVTPKKRRRR